jgi:hypothetical protein
MSSQGSGRISDVFQLQQYAMLKHPQGALTAFWQGACIDLILSVSNVARQDLATWPRNVWVDLNAATGGQLPISLFVDASGALYGRWHEVPVLAAPTGNEPVYNPAAPSNDPSAALQALTESLRTTAFGDAQSAIRQAIAVNRVKGGF